MWKSIIRQVFANYTPGKVIILCTSLSDCWGLQSDKIRFFLEEHIYTEYYKQGLFRGTTFQDEDTYRMKEINKQGKSTHALHKYNRRVQNEYTGKKHEVK